MKKILSLVWLVSSFTLLAAQCPVGDVILNSQADVNFFATNFGSCTTIPGNLTIDGFDITDLSGLQNLTAIDGNLVIGSNGQLTNLEGLQNIISIEENLTINGLFMVADVEGLRSLTTIGGDLNIKNNNESLDALTNVEGLRSLTTIGGDLNIESNNLLVNLNGLRSLTSIGGDLNISDNEVLTNLEGLENVTFFGGSILISQNQQLLNLNGLQNLRSINGDLDLRGNNALMNLDALKNLRSLEGGLVIFAHFGLDNVDGLQNLTTIGQLSAPNSIYSVIIENNGDFDYCGLFNLFDANADNPNFRAFFNDNDNSGNQLTFQDEGPCSRILLPEPAQDLPTMPMAYLAMLGLVILSISLGSLKLR